MEDLFLLWGAALVLMGSPGPATLSLGGMGIAYGFQGATSYLLGIMVGTAGVLLMIATGITALILARPILVTGLSILAGAYIVYLAWKIATAPVVKLTGVAVNAPGFMPGFLLAIANPKAFAAIGAVYASYTLYPERLVSDTFAKTAALSLVIVIVNVGWLAFGATFSHILSHPFIGRIMNVVFALLLLVSVGLALIRI